MRVPAAGCLWWRGEASNAIAGLRHARQMTISGAGPSERTDAIRTLDIAHLASRSDVEDLATFLKAASVAGAPSVSLDARGATRVFPNAAAPAAAVIQHFRGLGMDVRVQTGRESFFERTRVRNPLLATEANLLEPGSRLSVAWAYAEEHAVALTNCVIEELGQRVEFAAGVLHALNWCLYEVLDNVFQHARSEHGYFMAQILRNSQTLAVCVADAGIGVHRSFHHGGHYRPPTAFDALTLAVRENVTSTGEARGRGNGLYGLRGVVEHNGGRLEITSGRGLLTVGSTGIAGRNLPKGVILDADHHCTIVDFQLDLGRAVDINEVLGSEMPDMRLEAIETDTGMHVIQVLEHAQGTGTRAAAERLRTWLLNYLNEGAPYLVLDFAGVDMVSSSFADETIGKLAKRFGAIGFGQRFKLVNMTPTVQGLLDRAIATRLGSVG
jgi:anti-anti-sigma regulatory factor/anti-sigma regulatory factor (Ser/Thr protein kinase)